jgi:hypothetical protein
VTADNKPPANAATETKRLRDRVEQAPKGIRRRTRAKIGDRARWYELPEEASHQRGLAKPRQTHNTREV